MSVMIGYETADRVLAALHQLHEQAHGTAEPFGMCQADPCRQLDLPNGSLRGPAPRALPIRHEDEMHLADALAEIEDAIGTGHEVKIGKFKGAGKGGLA